MNDEKEIKGRIVDAAIKAFNEKGAKFRMDDVAALLSMSKKTLYKFFDSKDELILSAVDMGFTAVKESERKIIEDPDIDLAEKIKKVIIVIPDRYKAMDWRRLYEFKDSYPEAYGRIQYYLATGWEGTLGLLEEGIRLGIIKNVNLYVLQSMIESSFEGFIKNANLLEKGISYEEALEEMADIIMNGIKA